MRLFFRHKFTDLGPFRAIRYESLKTIAMQDTNFGWTVEMQIKAVKKGLRILEIPVKYRERVGVSKITGTFSGTIKAGTKIIYTIFKYLLTWLRVRIPLHKIGLKVHHAYPAGVARIGPLFYYTETISKKGLGQSVKSFILLVVELKGFEPLTWRADFSFALQPDKPLLNLRMLCLLQGNRCRKE